MSRFTQEEEKQIVKDAMTLTETIEVEKRELKELDGKRFRSKPSAPTRRILSPKKVNVEIPEPPGIKYSLGDLIKDLIKNRIVKILIIVFAALLLFRIVKGISTPFIVDYLIGVIALVAFWGVVISLFKKRTELWKNRGNDPEYLKTVEEIKRRAAEEQERINRETEAEQVRIDAEYAVAMVRYNKVILPEYEKELADFNAVKQQKMDAIREEIRFNEQTLDALYAETKLISLTYRDLNLLCWLYNDMSTSDHDMRYATELLDRDRQRIVTERAGYMAGSMAQKAVESLDKSITESIYAIGGAIEAGNSELVLMCRDMNRANALGIIQRHKLNKMVKDAAENE